MTETGGERPHLDEPKALSELVPEVLDEIQINQHGALLKKSTEGVITPAEEARLDELNAQLSEKFGDKPDPGP